MIAAVTMVKDEADIIAQTVGSMAEQCDLVIVADNGSTDGTREILEDLGVEVIDDDEPGYYQSRKVTALAHRAREEGAEWVIPFDADELWLSVNGNFRDLLGSFPTKALIAEAVFFDHVATAVDPEGDPIERLGYRRREVGPLRKVAVRALKGLEIHQGNHSASFYGTEHPLTITGNLQIRHYPYRSPEQMIRKVRNGAAAYAASDLPPEAGAHWRGYGQLSDEQITEVFHKWFYRGDPDQPIDIEGERQPPLLYDPPWSSS